jgi:hypothetical protein
MDNPIKTDLKETWYDGEILDQLRLLLASQEGLCSIDLVS